MRLYELSALMQTGETCALDRESVLSAVIEEALGEGFPSEKRLPSASPCAWRPTSTPGRKS